MQSGNNQLPNNADAQMRRTQVQKEKRTQIDMSVVYSSRFYSRLEP